MDDGIDDLLVASLWPVVTAAFRDADGGVEARVYQLDDFQVVVARLPASDSRRPPPDRRVTLDVWPPAGPRLLQIEWNGRRPRVVHRRPGDWVPRLIRASRRFD